MGGTWNSRKVTDAEQIQLAVQRTAGVRLYYRSPKGAGREFDVLVKPEARGPEEPVQLILPNMRSAAWQEGNERKKWRRRRRRRGKRARNP